ncbi:unnamed protein product [Clonostachys solani]|uniref:Uncharacterized protein n=1 Tax=Clonostachys solani TaxID=160281 RepID=A0A9N9Z1X6_9HYPO|nr:unnamed protein product [Clonostachys solani]
MPPATSSRRKESKDSTIGSLNDRLNYGDRLCKRRPERRGVLNDSIRNFEKNHGENYQKPRSVSDLKEKEYKDAMSQKASDFLKEEGPRLWPDEHSDSALYERALVWPKHKDKLQDLMTQMFLRKCFHKQKNERMAMKKRQSGHGPRGAGSSTMEIDDEPDNTPVTPRQRPPISEQRQLPQNLQTTGQSTTPHPVTVEDDDPSAPGEEDAVATQSRDEGHPARPLPRVAPSTTSIAPERAVGTGHSPFGITSSRSNVDGRNTSSSLTEGNLRVHDSNAPSLDNLHTREIDAISDDDDDDDMPPFEEIFSSPGRGQSNRKDKGKEIETERRKEMPPPRAPAERAVPVPDSDQGNQQIWSRQGPSSMSRFPSQQRGTSVFSTVECGRAPSLRPRAPEASMEGAMDEVTQPSVETDDLQHMNEGRVGGATTRKSPLEPEIWFRAIVSRKPPVEESWKPNGKFSDKTLAELKKELPFNFDNGDVVRLKFTLKSYEGMRIVETIDHNNRHDLQHLKRVFGERIREAMKERQGRDRGPVTFDIEIEAVKRSREMTVGREESLAPLLW